jgi:biopolymer transport protein ExbB
MQPKIRMKMKLHLVPSTARLTGLCVGVLLLACAGQARAWWNSDWTIRKKITIDTSSSGAPISDQIGTTAILIRLHDGNFRFTDAKEDGSDIRFVAADDKTLLTYHIEKYDSLLNEAFVWVRIPDLKPGAKTTFWLYYGNAGSKATHVDNPKGTYDVNTSLVYHFAERNGPPHDSTGYKNNAQKAGIPVLGSLIGPGIRFDGTNPITIPNSESLAWKDGSAITWSAWVKPIAKQPNTILFSRRDGANAFLIGADNGVPFVEVDGTSGTQRTKGAPAMPPNTWHHIAVTVAGSTIILYVDGKNAATLNAALPALTSPLSLGGDSKGGTGFSGEMDELEISKAARPAGFIKIAAMTQGTNKAPKLMTFGTDDVKTSWFSGGYIGVILSSLTVDGWAVICILVVMSAISWVVMVNKAKYLKATINGNKQFFRDWKDVAADLSFLDERDARKVLSLGGRIDNRERQIVKFASVYRIYKIGAEEIRHRLHVEGAAESHLLSARSIQAIRAMLDGALVKEGQKLNKLMVLLTIAISGGPFLGLLGTVIGVMITFAAIAAQGDVNVNAIAPGIAAALAATVAGLFVAIPALFGYNYLLSQVKDATSDMHIFIDEFVTKIAEYYGGSRNGQHNHSGEDVEMEMLA